MLPRQLQARLSRMTAVRVLDLALTKQLPHLRTEALAAQLAVVSDEVGQ